MPNKNVETGFWMKEKDWLLCFVRLVHPSLEGHEASVFKEQGVVGSWTFF